MNRKVSSGKILWKFTDNCFSLEKKYIYILKGTAIAIAIDTDADIDTDIDIWTNLKPRNEIVGC